MKTAVAELEIPIPDIERKLRALDSRLDDLRARRKKAETELERLTKEEARLTRGFSEAAGREKHNLRTQIDAVATKRVDQEREMRGLASAIAEAEEERTRLLPEFEKACAEKARRVRQMKLDSLRREHDRNLEAVRVADKALLAAREATEKSFFAWTTFKDQEAVNAQLAAQEVLKVEWQKNAGPNAPANRR